MSNSFHTPLEWATLRTLDFSEGTWEGYLWWSNKEEPTLIRHSTPTILSLLSEEAHFPYIREGFLTNQQRAISIFHLDDRYSIHQYDLAQLEKSGLQYETISYMAHSRLGGAPRIEKVVFYQVYAEQPDPYEEAFVEAIPLVKIFKGFAPTER